MTPLVYTVVLNYNGQRWLERCLGSLLAGGYPRGRVLLVDNGSNDHSLALARRYGPRIEILENRANLGFSRGNNRAIAYALEQGADYVALLNNDTYVEPDWLARIVEVGEASPQIGILGPVQLVFDGSEFNTWMTAVLPEKLELLRRRDEPGFWLPVEWVEGSSLVAKRRVFETIGCLDAIFAFFFEECDLCRRARAAGFEIAIVPSSKIHHHRGASFGELGLTGRRDFLLLRNSMIYSGTDPQATAFQNMRSLLRSDATHLKEALLGTGQVAVWCRANGSLVAHMPALYRKWRTDRQTIASFRSPRRQDTGRAGFRKEAPR